MIRAPFPWFGGKSRVADLVWQRFGDVKNYVEPFAGSLAVLLGRPHWPWKGHRIETANDLDTYLSNFWRALKTEPESVAYWADWPVNEADLHARHWWLVKRREFREQMRSDPDYYDVKVAGWWVWGICQWIGSGWCAIRQDDQQLPHLGNPGMGVHRPSQQLPHLGDSGRGEIHDYLMLLGARLRTVRVCCGDWKRVLGPTPTAKLGITGIFLDPPYSDQARRKEDLYSVDDLDVARDVRRWAIERGDDRDLRIALCGYENEHDLSMPESWNCVAWKNNAGYAAQNKNVNDNRFEERIWFSPYCENPATMPMQSRMEFADAELLS